MLDKKQIWAIFLFEFKMGCKAAEINCNINNTYGPGTAKERTVQWWLKKLSEGDESLEDEKRNDQPSEVDNDQLRRSSKLMLLQLHEKLPKNSTSTILQSVSIWSKLEKWNSLISGYLMSWLQVKKIIILKCCLLLFYAAKTNHFWIGLWHAMNSAFYMTTGNDQLSGWTEKKLQSTSQSQRKVMVTVWWAAARLIHYSFLNPGTTITFEKYVQQMNEMPRKWQLLQPALANRTGPILLHDSAWLYIAQPELPQLNKLGYEVMLHPPYSPDFLPPNYHCFTHLDNFLQGKCFHHQQEAEKGVQEPLKSRTTDIYAIGISKLISHWQKCVNCKGSYFD